MQYDEKSQIPSLKIGTFVRTFVPCQDQKRVYAVGIGQERGVAMRLRYGILAAFLLLAACLPFSKEIDLSDIRDYVDIPASAQEVEAVYFQHGQSKEIFVRFKLTEAQFNNFLSATCFGSINDFFSKYVDFNIDSTFAGAPDWWIISRANSILEGRCDQNGVSLGIGVFEEEDSLIIYLIIFIP